jgi:hypothetical protein
MIGKKKTKDVQFYVEIMESSYSLDAARRSGYDPVQHTFYPLTPAGAAPDTTRYTTHPF